MTPLNFGGFPIYNSGLIGAVSTAFYTTSTNSTGAATNFTAGAATSPYMDSDPSTGFPFAPVVATATQASDPSLASALNFQIITTAQVIPGAGQAAYLIVLMNGTGAANPSKFYAPLAGINGGPCASNLCTGIQGVNVPVAGHYYAAPFTSGMTVQIYPEDICADYYSESVSQQGFGCIAPLPAVAGIPSKVLIGDPAAAIPVAAVPMQLTWQIVYLQTSDGTQSIQGTPPDQGGLNLQFQGSAQPWTCPTDLGSPNRYFPGDGTITLDATEFPGASSTANTPFAQLVTLAQLEASPPTASAPVFDRTFVNSPPTLSSGAGTNAFYYRAGFSNTEIIPNPVNTTVSFLNTTGGSTNSYTLGFMIRDYGGLVNPLPSSGTPCILANVQTSKILTFLNQSKCFIATAAFRSIDAAPVTMLRQFRDEILLKNEYGTEFVHWYYHWSPPAAEWLMKHPQVRMPVLEALVPVEVVAWFMLHPVQLTLLFVLGLSSVVLGIIFAVIMKAKRRTQG